MLALAHTSSKRRAEEGGGSGGSKRGRLSARNGRGAEAKIERAAAEAMDPGVATAAKADKEEKGRKGKKTGKEGGK